MRHSLSLQGVWKAPLQGCRALLPKQYRPASLVVPLAVRHQRVPQWLRLRRMPRGRRRGGRDDSRLVAQQGIDGLRPAPQSCSRQGGGAA